MLCLAYLCSRYHSYNDHNWFFHELMGRLALTHTCQDDRRQMSDTFQFDDARALGERSRACTEQGRPLQLLSHIQTELVSHYVRQFDKKEPLGELMHIYCIHEQLGLVWWMCTDTGVSRVSFTKSELCSDSMLFTTEKARSKSALNQY